MKALIIGIDGGTFKQLIPLAERGVMPALAALMKRGARSPLKSTVPPITGPAWFAFATGMNPGTTGIFDLMVRTAPDSLELKPLDSTRFRGNAFWDLLSERGLRIGIMNFPLLYPAYETNGYMISGIGSSRFGDITYPVELKKDLDRVTGTYELVVVYTREKYKGNDKLFFADTERMMTKHKKAAEFLFANYPSDVVTAVFSASDVMQHYSWSAIDPAFPGYDPERAKKVAPMYENIWRMLDDTIGDLVAKAGPEANIFIVSDHGFGALHHNFNVAAWLVKKGYMVLKEGGEGKESGGGPWWWSDSFNELAVTAVKRLIPDSIARKLNKARAGGGHSFSDRIDIDKSEVLAIGHTNPFGALYFNPSKFKRGEASYAALRERLISDLNDLSAEAGFPIEIDYYFPDEYYRGPGAATAPDVVFSVNDWSCTVSDRKLDGPIFENTNPNGNLTGSHRMEGILIAAGPAVRNVELSSPPSIADLFPTIFYSIGEAIPPNLDGRVILEMFDESQLGSPVYSDQPWGNLRLHEETASISAEDEEIMKKNLEGLGYL